MARIGIFLALLGWAQAQPDTWKEGARMPTARSEMRAARIDSLVYVPGGFGGTTKLEAYHPAADRWVTGLRDLPQALHHMMVEAYQGKLYVIKGNNWMYDPAANSWTAKTGPRYARPDGTALAFGPHIYVIGGEGQQVLERYAPDTDTWTQLAPMKVNRGHVQAVLLDGKFYVLGGRDQGVPLKSVEIYNPADNTWTDGPPMLDYHTGHAAVVLGNKILVAGGEMRLGNNPPQIIKSAEIFDPVAGKWTLVKDMPTPVHGTASLAFNGKFYVLGGSYQAYASVNSNQVFIYEPPVGTIAVRPGQARPDSRAGFLPRLRLTGGAKVIWGPPAGPPGSFRDGLGRAAVNNEVSLGRAAVAKDVSLGDRAGTGK